MGGDVPIGGKFTGEYGIGYDFGNQWRVEGTYSHGGGDIDGCNETKNSGVSCTITDGNVDTSTFLVSGYYDFKLNDSKLKPFIGGGIGTSNFDIDKVKISSTSYNVGDDSTFTWQLKLGAAYEVSEKADIFIEGFYKEYGDMEIAGWDFEGINEKGARIGTRIRF